MSTRLKNLTLPLLALPALAVTLASLAALVSSVLNAAAASRPGDLLFPLRQPALEVQLGLTLDPAERAAIEEQIDNPPASASFDEMFGQAATPSETDAPPTGTRAPASTPLPVEPSRTPGSSGGPGPSPSNTPEPTEADDDKDDASATPGDSSGPGPSASNTPRPSRTPEPTETERPTETPRPTDTPRPTETPEPTQAPPTPTPGSGSGGPGPSPSNTPEPEDVDFEGTLESISGSTWVIAGQAVLVTAETEIRDNPQIGDLVEVRALRYADGSLVATRIERE